MQSTSSARGKGGTRIEHTRNLAEDTWRNLSDPPVELRFSRQILKRVGDVVHDLSQLAFYSCPKRSDSRKLTIPMDPQAEEHLVSSIVGKAIML